MAEKIGRLGSLGLAIEATSGTPESTPDVFIPFTENSLRGHHEPLIDQSARGSRVAGVDSAVGKKWGEGSITMYLDSINAGYLLKLALGLEARTQKNATPPVHDHLLIPTVSGNAATTATLWDNKGVDSEQYAFAAIDTLEIEVNTDGIATVQADFMSKAPTTVSAPAFVPTSGTLYTWKDMNVRFGSTVAAAIAASPTKVSSFNLSIANNLELKYKSGSNQPDEVDLKQLEITGSYTLYFENITDRDAYYNLTKRSMVVQMTGANLGTGGYTELLQIVLRQVVIEDIDMETGLDDMFAITCNFRAEVSNSQAGFAEITLRNGKATDYA